MNEFARRFMNGLTVIARNPPCDHIIGLSGISNEDGHVPVHQLAGPDAPFDHFGNSVNPTLSYEFRFCPRCGEGLT